MMEVVQFRAEHYVDIIKGKNVWWLGKIDPLAIGKSYEVGIAYSGFWDGKLVAIAGIVCPWPGMGEAWAVLSIPDSPGCVLSINRHLRRIFGGMIRNMGLKRIQANVDVGSQVAIRWAEWLGFKQEGGIMRKYGPNGEDFLRLVMFPEENGNG